MSIHIPEELRIRIPDCATETFVWYRSKTSPPQVTHFRRIGMLDCVWAMNIDGTVHMVEDKEVRWLPEQWPFWCPIGNEMHKTCLIQPEYEIEQLAGLCRVKILGANDWIAKFKSMKDALDFIEMKKAKS